MATATPAPEYPETLKQNNEALPPGETLRTRDLFETVFEKLVDESDLAIVEFHDAVEFRRQFSWLDEADEERGLTYALMRALSGSPAGSSHLNAVEVEVHLDEDYRRRLKAAVSDIKQNFWQYIAPLAKLTCDRGISMDDAIRRYLLGYVASCRYGLSGDPW